MDKWFCGYFFTKKKKKKLFISILQEKKVDISFMFIWEVRRKGKFLFPNTVIIVVIEALFIVVSWQVWGGKMSEKFFIHNTFQKDFIVHFTDADNTVYKWYCVGGKAGSLDKVSFIFNVVYSTKD